VNYIRKFEIKINQVRQQIHIVHGMVRIILNSAFYLLNILRRRKKIISHSLQYIMYFVLQGMVCVYNNRFVYAVNKYGRQSDIKNQKEIKHVYP
jgi:hypothetical protein